MFSPDASPKNREIHPEQLTRKIEDLAVLEGKINRLYLRLNTDPVSHDSGDTHIDFEAITDSNRAAALSEWKQLEEKYSQTIIEWNEYSKLLDPLRIKPGESANSDLALKIEQSFASLDHLRTIVAVLTAWAEKASPQPKQAAA